MNARRIPFLTGDPRGRDHRPAGIDRNVARLAVRPSALTLVFAFRLRRPLPRDGARNLFLHDNRNRRQVLRPPRLAAPNDRRERDGETVELVGQH